MIQKGFSGLRARLTGLGKNAGGAEAEEATAQHMRIPAYVPEMETGSDGIEALRKVLGTDGPEPLEQAICRVRKVPTQFDDDTAKDWAEEPKETLKAATAAPEPAAPSALPAIDEQSIEEEEAELAEESAALARAKAQAEVMPKANALPEVEPSAPPKRRFGALLSAMRLGQSPEKDKPEFSPRVEKRLAADPFVKRLARLN